MATPTRHGSKWRIRWLDEKGRRRSAVYAKHREACEQLSLKQSEVQQVRQGLRRAVPAARTFDELADYWLESRAPVKRSAKDDQSIIRQLRAHFDGAWLRDISPLDVDAYSRSKHHLTAKTLRSHLTLLQTMLRKAHDLGWLHHIPRVEKPRVPTFRADYRSLRSESEIRRFLESARQHSPAAYTLYSCALYTGARKGELARLQWSDVDTDRRLITIQRSFNGPTKAGRVRYVPILDPLRPVLAHWATQRESEWVFVGAQRRPLGASAKIYSRRRYTRCCRALDSPTGASGASRNRT